MCAGPVVAILDRDAAVINSHSSIFQTNVCRAVLKWHSHFIAWLETYQVVVGEMFMLLRWKRLGLCQGSAEYCREFADIDLSEIGGVIVNTAGIGDGEECFESNSIDYYCGSPHAFEEFL